MNDFKYIVILKSSNLWSHYAKCVWCTLHDINGDDRYVRITSSTDTWFFRHEQDAMAFRLRYGDCGCSGASDINKTV